MDYIEYMNNLRAAFQLIKSKIPEIGRIAVNKAIFERDRDLEILLKSEKEWEKAQENYFDVEPKLYRFNPEEEYGVVHTMWPEDMRGERDE